MKLPNNVPLFSTYSDLYYWTRDNKKTILIHQGGTSCHAPDTLVITNRGNIPIKDVKEGDLVESYNEITNSVEIKKVINTFEYINSKKTVKVKLKNGESIIVTDDHEYYFEGKWTPIKDILKLLSTPFLKITPVASFFLELDDIESWEYVDDCEKVYDIEVEDTHNYFIHAGKHILVHNSGKTYAIMQNVVRLAIEKSRIIHVIGQDAPNLYRGAITDFKRLLDDSPILKDVLKNPNLDRGPFKFKNGSTIHFITAQTAQDAKSGKRDILFINEANGLTYEIAFELIARTTEQVFIDYNPNARFWVHQELVGQEDVQMIISNFTHNPHCPQNIKKQIISWKQKADETGSAYWKNKWRVYGLGLTGVVEGVVFDNVNECDFFPLAAKHVIYGLDFGFKNNYTALCKLGVYNNSMYGKEMLYEQRLNSSDLPDRLTSIGITKTDRIIADPANDEAITILQSKGYNIVPAKKGQDSIKAGIELIQSLPLYLTKDSVNWWSEVENYKYTKDKNGKFTNNPIDDYNDLWDAARYAYTELFGLRLAKAKKTTNQGYKRRMVRT